MIELLVMIAVGWVLGSIVAYALGRYRGRLDERSRRNQNPGARHEFVNHRDDGRCDICGQSFGAEIHRGDG